MHKLQGRNGLVSKAHSCGQGHHLEGGDNGSSYEGITYSHLISVPILYTTITLQAVETGVAPNVDIPTGQEFKTSSQENYCFKYKSLNFFLFNLPILFSSSGCVASCIVTVWWPMGLLLVGGLLGMSII